MSDLIEKVARALCQVDEQNGGAPWDWYGSDKARSGYFEQARAAVSIVLEECAKVAEERRRYFVVGPDVRQYVSFSAKEAGAAIRALAEAQENNHGIVK